MSAMYRKISIGWFKQKSGAYALKGITIREGDHAYDSTSTFRDEDAKWLTGMLGAQPDVELSTNNRGLRSPDDYPAWALKTGEEPESNGVPALDWERAKTTLLRDVLGSVLVPQAAIHKPVDLREIVVVEFSEGIGVRLGTLDQLFFVRPRQAHRANSGRT